MRDISVADLSRRKTNFIKTKEVRMLVFPLFNFKLFLSYGGKKNFNFEAMTKLRKLLFNQVYYFNVRKGIAIKLLISVILKSQSEI